jgi:hypothetical protein
MFEALLTITAAVVAGGVAWGAYGHNDTLHPLIFLMPAAGFMYVIRPWSLYRDGALEEFFTAAELTFIQGFSLACVAALAFGCVWGSRHLRRDANRLDLHSYLSSTTSDAQLYRLALTLGGIGILLYLYGLYNVGGFVAAYNAPKGGGWAATGYLRDFKILVVPAIILLFMSRGKTQWRSQHTLLVALFSSPLLIHGLLSARRGPTFMGIVCVVVSWYLSRHTRPVLWKVLAGGAATGILLLVLVTFRGQIYLGSSFFGGEGPTPTFVIEQGLERTDEAKYGNEYIYGGYSLLGASRKQDFYWGKRYLTYVFIRPIPSALWPSKYEDVGMGEVNQNAGTLIRASGIPTERLPMGAAPGFAADLYLEFWWFALLATMGIGWLYGFAWRRNVTHGGWWRVLYVTLLVFSLYLVAQTMEAVLFRFLEVLIPTTLGWAAMRQGNLTARRERVAHLLSKRAPPAPS